MDKEVKQRIDQLNNGEIPKGYQKTDFGVFPNDWVTDNTLGDLFDFYGGLSKSRDELSEEGYAYLHYGDLHRGTFNTVSFDQYEQLPKCDISLNGKEKCLMKDGDVAFLDASEDLEGTSRAVLIDNPENKPFIAGLHIIYGKAKNNSLDKWFKQYITSSESVKKQFQRLAVGFKVYGVNRDTIPRIRVAFPSSHNEQSRIAEILMKWDEAIELYDKQIEALTRYKTVCLRKMFPAKGQSVPEWRFRGFTDAWEQRKLGDIGSVAMCRRVFKHQTSESGEIPFFKIGTFGGTPDAFISKELFDDYKAKYPYPEKGDILISASGSIGRTVVFTGENEYFQDSNIVWLKHDKSIINPFLRHLYEVVKWAGIEGSTIKRLYNDNILKTEIMLPSVVEQTKIAEMLDGIDNLITLHQRKKEAITNQRKTLQQNLLNGIIRV